MNPPAGGDLARGSVIRALLRLAWPMLVGALLQNIQSLIDLYWVGRMGSDSVAAIALSTTVLMTLFPLVMGAATGTVALVSRRFGERRYDEAARVGAQSLALGLVMGAAAGLVGVMQTHRICVLLGAGPDVLPAAEAYLRISFAGSFTVFLLFIGSSVLQSAGNTLVPMLAMAAANLLNLVLDPILMFGWLGLPALGIRGAALATILSQMIAACIIVYLLFSGRVRVHIRPAHFLPNPAILAGLLRVGLPGTGQMLARSAMSLVLMRIVAACGTAAVAGYGIGLRIQALLLLPAFALGNAAATMVGQNLGAGRPDRAARAAWVAAWLDASFMAVAAAAISATAPYLIGMFDRNQAVMAVGSDFIRITTGFYVFTAFAVVLGRALQGAGDTIAPMIFTFVALWGLQVPLAIWLSDRTVPATDGIWWAIAAAVALHGVLVTAWFALGRWKSRRV